MLPRGPPALWLPALRTLSGLRLRNLITKRPKWPSWRQWLPQLAWLPAEQVEAMRGVGVHCESSVQETSKVVGKGTGDSGYQPYESSGGNGGNGGGCLCTLGELDG